MLSHITSQYLIVYHIVSYYLILSHIISYYLILSHIISYYFILSHIISYYLILYHIISYYLILYHIISYCILPHFLGITRGYWVAWAADFTSHALDGISLSEGAAKAYGQRYLAQGTMEGWIVNGRWEMMGAVSKWSVYRWFTYEDN